MELWGILKSKSQVFFLIVSAAEQLLDITSYHFSLRGHFVHVWEMIQTLVQRPPTSKTNVFHSKSRPTIPVGPSESMWGFSGRQKMKWSLDGWRNQPANWENGWGSVISFNRIFIGNRDSVHLWLLKGWWMSRARSNTVLKVLIYHCNPLWDVLCLTFSVRPFS